MNRLWAAAAAALALALFASCDDAAAPKDPVWGKQACGSCAMLVSDPHYAAQLVTTDGSRSYFDDPGCMAAYLDERHPSVRAMWVKDDVGHWVDAKTASFARGAKSPMDYGFAAQAGGTASWADVEAEAKKRKEGAR